MFKKKSYKVASKVSKHIGFIKRITQGQALAHHDASDASHLKILSVTGEMRECEERCVPEEVEHSCASQHRSASIRTSCPKSLAQGNLPTSERKGNSLLLLCTGQPTQQQNNRYF